MSASKLDAVYRSILLTKFFTKGWGKPENLKRLFEFRKVVSNRDECFKLVDRDYPVTITKEQKLSDCHIFEGYFLSPLEKYLPGIVPEIAQKAHFQAVLPLNWQDPKCKPVCLHLAGTGDHFFWRRRNLMVKPLLKEAGIGGIILENPFYGLRKPTDQIRSSLHNVSDIFVMGGCLILESLVIFHWCERNGLGPLGVTGLSMGGHMASLAATNWPKPLVLVPCLSWSTASAVFLQGVMAHSINWDLLEDQYLSDGIYREKLSKMVTIVDEAFLAGKKFVRTFSRSMGTQAKTIENKENNSVPNNTSSKDAQKNKLDITYREANTPTKEIIIEDKQSQEKIESVVKVEKHNRLSENIRTELTKLYEAGKINQLLYEKLMSNEKFELDAKDIEEINMLSEEQVKEALFKSRVGNENQSTIPDPAINTSDTKQSNSKSEQPKESENEKDEKRKSWNVTDFTSDLFTGFPFVKFRNERKIDIGKIHWRDREALQFMRGIMDECTHLSNFSVPFDTSLIIAVCAKHDAYVPRDDVGALEEIWPGAEVRYVDAGHVSAYLLHQSLFRSCIAESFERSKKRWKDGKHVD